MELALNNSRFTDLNHDELSELDGGTPIHVALGVGLLGAFIYSVADEAVKQSTGESIATNTVNYVKSTWSSMEGKWLYL